jgi:hypothetical protein
MHGAIVLAAFAALLGVASLVIVFFN